MEAVGMFKDIAVLINTTDETHHDHENSCTINPIYQNAMVALFVIVFSLSIIENSLLWIIMGLNKSLRTHGNIYVLSLSVSDAFTTVSIGWIEIYRMLLYPQWDFGMLGSSLYNAFWCFSLVTPFAHISVITVECYMVISSGRHHRKKRRRQKINLLLIWSYSICITSLMAFHFIEASDSRYVWNVLPEWYYPFLGIHLTVPLFLCSFLYIRILKIAQETRRRIDTFQETSTFESMRLARTVAVIIIFLFIVWLPVNIIEVLFAVLSHSCEVSQLGSFSVWLTCTSGVINPIIFIWRNNRVQRILLKHIFCVKTSYPNSFSLSSDDKQLKLKNGTWLSRRRNGIRRKEILDGEQQR